MSWVDVREFHAAWAWFVIIGNAVAGLWVLGAHWIGALRRRAMCWFVALAQSTVAVQVGLGFALLGPGGYEVETFHVFYGVVATLTVAVLFSYRSQLRHRIHLLYGLGGLFLAGLGIRAMLVAG